MVTLSTVLGFYRSDRALSKKLKITLLVFRLAVRMAISVGRNKYSRSSKSLRRFYLISSNSIALFLKRTRITFLARFPRRIALRDIRSGFRISFDVGLFARRGAAVLHPALFFGAVALLVILASISPNPKKIDGSPVVEPAASKKDSRRPSAEFSISLPPLTPGLPDKRLTVM